MADPDSLAWEFTVKLQPAHAISKILEEIVKFSPTAILIVGENDFQIKADIPNHPGVLSLHDSKWAPFDTTVFCLRFNVRVWYKRLKNSISINAYSSMSITKSSGSNSVQCFIGNNGQKIELGHAVFVERTPVDEYNPSPFVRVSMEGVNFRWFIEDFISIDNISGSEFELRITPSYVCWATRRGHFLYSLKKWGMTLLPSDASFQFRVRWDRKLFEMLCSAAIGCETVELSYFENDIKQKFYQFRFKYSGESCYLSYVEEVPLSSPTMVMAVPYFVALEFTVTLQPVNAIINFLKEICKFNTIAYLTVKGEKEFRIEADIPDYPGLLSLEVDEDSVDCTLDACCFEFNVREWCEFLNSSISANYSSSMVIKKAFGSYNVHCLIGKVNKKMNFKKTSVVEKLRAYPYVSVTMGGFVFRKIIEDFTSKDKIHESKFELRITPSTLYWVTRTTNIPYSIKTWGMTVFPSDASFQVQGRWDRKLFEMLCFAAIGCNAVELSYFENDAKQKFYGFRFEYSGESCYLSYVEEVPLSSPAVAISVPHFASLEFSVNLQPVDAIHNFLNEIVGFNTTAYLTLMGGEEFHIEADIPFYPGLLSLSVEEDTADSIFGSYTFKINVCEWLELLERPISANYISSVSIKKCSGTEDVHCLIANDTHSLSGKVNSKVQRASANIAVPLYPYVSVTMGGSVFRELIEDLTSKYAIGHSELQLHITPSTVFWVTRTDNMLQDVIPFHVKERDVTVHPNNADLLFRVRWDRKLFEMLAAAAIECDIVQIRYFKNNLKQKSYLIKIFYTVPRYCICYVEEVPTRWQQKLDPGYRKV